MYDSLHGPDEIKDTYKHPLEAVNRVQTVTPLEGLFVRMNSSRR